MRHPDEPPVYMRSWVCDVPGCRPPIIAIASNAPPEDEVDMAIRILKHRLTHGLGPQDCHVFTAVNVEFIARPESHYFPTRHE